MTKKIKVECFTDNHKLYGSVYLIRPIQDKRSQTEITLLRKMINKKGIAKIGLKINIRIQTITKYGVSSEKLVNTLKTKSVEFL